MVYDHYGLFLIPLVVHEFARGNYRFGSVLVCAFGWWSLAPAATAQELHKLPWILYESTRPLLVLALGIVSLERTVRACGQSLSQK
jgi:hypothetical protein